jgi:hypothetical protein
MLVEHRHLRDWKQIADMVPGRTARQCRDRYRNYLTDQRFPREWAEAEDQTIIEAYRRVGSRWSIIANFLPGRKPIDVKNRWHRHIAHVSAPRTFQMDLEQSREEERQARGQQVTERRSTEDNEPDYFSNGFLTWADDADFTWDSTGWLV